MAVPDAPGRMPLAPIVSIHDRKTLKYGEIATINHRAKVDQEWARLVRDNERLREEVLRLGDQVQVQAALAAIVRVWIAGIWPGHDMEHMVVNVGDYAPNAEVRVPLTYGILRALLANSKGE